MKMEQIEDDLDDLEKKKIILQNQILELKIDLQKGALIKRTKVEKIFQKAGSLLATRLIAIANSFKDKGILEKVAACVGELEKQLSLEDEDLEVQEEVERSDVTREILVKEKDKKRSGRPRKKKE